MKQVTLIYQEPLSSVAIWLSSRLIENGFAIVAMDSSAYASADGITLILYGPGENQDVLGFRQTWINAVRQPRQAYLVVVGEEPATNLPVQLRRLTLLRLPDQSVDSINALVQDIEHELLSQAVTTGVTASVKPSESQ
jgi:hypothetical protein